MTITLMVALFSTACASSSADGSDLGPDGRATSPDATPRPDGPMADRSDAMVAVPDARVPDAEPAAPDAAPLPPDAAPLPPDAAPPSACGVSYGVTVVLANRAVAVDSGSEANYTAPAGHVITGIGARVSSDNVTTMRVRYQQVLAPGELGPPTATRAGSEPTGNIEANIDLPPCYVVVGVGGRINSDRFRTLVVWGSRILADGSLGPAEEFRAGTEPTAAVELSYQAPSGRVVSGVGFRSSSDDLAGLLVATDEWRY